ncbi:hypothetical protein [Lactococcus ileimucosae]|uniref:hypothetical protein n=1 Tax=Lactococcus ileimucosae TaxID=2941329 RepID=UPI003511CB8D
MKIVLNKCFGGFELSHEAKMEIFKKRGIEVFPYIINWRGDGNFYEKYEGLAIERFHNSLTASIVYFKEDPKVDSFIEKIFEKTEYDPIYLEFDYENREDGDLVEVVEKLGKLASGRFSELKVVEIPDGASYKINDYDGFETAYYGFQLGSV